MTNEKLFYEGRCTCGDVHYRMKSEPMFVHCCFCRWCQRETGTSYALNGMIESDLVEILKGKVEVVHIPTRSGKGQTIHRCPKCRIALWGHYAGAGDTISFVRIGTLNNPDLFPPDIQIYTSSKQPWVILSPDIPSVSEFYKASEFWPEESLERRSRLRKTN
ncbi:MAG: GFA family protein [Proteobacteria bacterium]|nr:GFA family protein [Pseudomonadota bacterium]